MIRFDSVLTAQAALARGIDKALVHGSVLNSSSSSTLAPALLLATESGLDLPAALNLHREVQARLAARFQRRLTARLNQGKKTPPAPDSPEYQLAVSSLLKTIRRNDEAVIEKATAEGFADLEKVVEELENDLIYGDLPTPDPVADPKSTGMLADAARASTVLMSDSTGPGNLKDFGAGAFEPMLGTKSQMSRAETIIQDPADAAPLPTQIMAPPPNTDLAPPPPPTELAPLPATPSSMELSLDMDIDLRSDSSDDSGSSKPDTRSFAEKAAQAAEVDESSPLYGTGLASKYTILKKLGQGGMGAVYLAEETGGERRLCALKLALKEQLSEDAIARLKREILCNSFVHHPGIIEIFDGGATDNGAYYMAMEYFNGIPLSKRLKNSPKLPIRKVLEVFSQALDALEFTHEARIVHRDIKPENFMISEADGEIVIKLMDFGIARILDEEQEFSDQFFRTMEGQLTGSPAYMAPESITGDAADGRADLYSLGVALFEMTVGKLPFKAATAPEYLQKHLYDEPPVPEELGAHRGVNETISDFILKLMAKSPKQRFQTCAEVKECLTTKVIPSLDRRRDTGRTMAFDPSKIQEPETPGKTTDDSSGEQSGKDGEAGWLGNIKKKFLG